MRIVFRSAAAADLRSIGDWIARDNPARAESFISELQERATRLATMSGRGPVVARTHAGPVHKLTHGRYILYYRIRADRVEVLAIRHGARQAPAFN